ncbi:alpha-ketoglutarate-dependent dioxygenase AlkB family protein [Sapientia aquatica]|uniref:Alpha-ketoglutarate-dependent dioxygenase AlkB n=1 Tax=Sapientia aquatica TaxID=1549640 RepID=A0A4R5W2I5_9BURK|nr:alpha-ketoglutarate-dependent dioxygenase AlkB [Sapientia aquatica]TDK65284.1 alpha-ketoglutarate-dependent dioxygenase AlkB [Sapientia aquatica]
MDLFQSEIINLLPYDGEANYHGLVMTPEQARHYFDVLLRDIEWKNDEAIIFNKHIITKRKVAWYGDRQFAYTYSKTTKLALPWTQELLELKLLAERLSGATYNSCLLNLYHDGSEGMAWHSDDEQSLGPNTVIASISLGATRKFAFKHKRSKETHSLILEHGSLLVMQGATQTHWLHRLPPTTTVSQARVNLTFRTIIDQ